MSWCSRWASRKASTPFELKPLEPQPANPQRSVLTGSSCTDLRRLVVDLGALEAPGVVDVDRLPLRIGVKRRVPGFAMAVAGALHAAEREVRLGADRAGVDVNDAGLEIVHRPERRVRVAREDRR